MSHLGVVGRCHLVLTVFHTHIAYAFLSLLTSSLFHVAFLCDKSSTSVCIHFDRVVLTCSYFDVSSERGRSSIFLLFIGISNPGSIKIERGMKNYFWSLVLRFFGLMGSSLVPGEGPR